MHKTKKNKQTQKNWVSTEIGRFYSIYQVRLFVSRMSETQARYETCVLHSVALILSYTSTHVPQKPLLTAHLKSTAAKTLGIVTNLSVLPADTAGRPVVIPPLALSNRQLSSLEQDN